MIGVATALFAATIALAQNDIKRVLAYSTISQLGYMFLAVGMGAYAAAMFFLVAHAFFKALMFLGAGSVIHGMHDEQDMRSMGGLRKAHADHVRDVPGRRAGARRASRRSRASSRRTRSSRSPSTPGGRGLRARDARPRSCPRSTSAGCCSSTFFGAPRTEEAEHAHESPSVLRVPLAILAAGAVVAGLWLASVARRARWRRSWSR